MGPEGHATETAMNLVKFTTDDNPVYINPEMVVSVKKGMKDTAITTTAGMFTVKEPVDIAMRLLGADEEARDITPGQPLLTRSIDI
jgi:hypothetical protein